MAPSRRPGGGAPWFLAIPAVASALCVAGPLVYLLIRAGEVDGEAARQIVMRWRNVELLGNTLLLTGTVLGVVTVLALPMAWLLTRTDLPLRRMWGVVSVMPLAIPGYLLAYTLLSIGGAYGTSALLLGVAAPRIDGVAGAVIALSLYNLPYMLLNLCVAMRRADPALEEVGRSLGRGPWAVFFRVTLPQLRPAFFSGALVVALHVIGDFGVVSLMRFDTFTFALYQTYMAPLPSSRGDAAWLALMLIGLTGLLLVVDMRYLRNLRLDPTGVATRRPHRVARLGVWRGAALTGMGLVSGVSVAAPVVTMVFWTTRHPGGMAWGAWGEALWDSVSAAGPAAAVATLLAAPVAFLAQRHRCRWTRWVEQSTYIGYATPAMAFALGLVFVTRRVDGWGWLPGMYQTMFVLVGACAVHFMAEAVGPIRSALYVASPRLEEASRSLGRGRWSTFMTVTLPLLGPGLAAAMVLVFLSVMKELPLTFILAPLNYSTLAMRVWDYTSDARYAEAAPYALTLMVVCGLFVGAAMAREGGVKR